MCHNKELFTTLNPLQKSTDVVLGDGRALQAIGKGKIILEMYLPNGESKACTLHNVFTYQVFPIIFRVCHKLQRRAR